MDSTEILAALVRALVGKARLPRWQLQQELAAARVDAQRILAQHPRLTLAQARAWSTMAA